MKAAGTRRIEEPAADRRGSRGEFDQLVAIIRRRREPVMVMHIVEDLRLLDLYRVIQLVDEYEANRKIISEAPDQQGEDAGDNIDAAVFGEELHGGHKARDSRRTALYGDRHAHREQAALTGRSLDADFTAANAGPFIDMGEPETVRRPNGIEPLAVVADAQVHLVFHTMKRYAYLRGAGVAHDILDLFLYDPEQGQFPFLSEELDLRPFVMCELDRIGSAVPDVVHQPGDMVDQAELVEM